MVANLIKIDSPDSWPKELRSYLDEQHDVFVGWSRGGGRVPPMAFDYAIEGLIEVLQQYVIIGWHCTRLTNFEIAYIQCNGMQLPDTAMLHRRIESLVAANLITDDISQRLKDKNQSEEKNRAGMIWFCFFPPRFAGEHAIERFFRHWGGEALYNLHEDDLCTSPVISKIGTPCVIEAEVPISFLGKNANLSLKIVQQFLANRADERGALIKHEDRIIRPLAGEYVRRIVSFPSAEFFVLTDCCNWRLPIK